MDLSKYKALFVSESQEHLQSMTQYFLTLEKNPEDEEAIAGAFRNAHSIKGMSASMGYDLIRDLAHSMEDLMDDFRQKLRKLSPEDFELLFEAADLLQEMLGQVERDEELSPKAKELEEKIRAHRKKKSLQPLERPEIKQEEEKGTEKRRDNYFIKVIFSREADSPSLRGMLLFKRLGEIGEIVSSKPDVEEVKAGKLLEGKTGFEFFVELKTTATKEEVEKVLKRLAEVVEYSFESSEAEKEKESKEKQAVIVPSETFGFSQLSPTIRIRTSILDDFINSLGEILLIKSELREIARHYVVPGLLEGLDRLERIVREFHEQVMRVRLMPLEGLVERLPRVVRDLAKTEGKKVEFEIIGKEIELDRAILEQLPDPLLHIIRNAVGHGIEPEEERIKLGKSPTGRVVLEARREREMVVIEISDDGRGISTEKLKNVAIEKGLISPQEAERMKDEEALGLIFRSGFSTAGRVGLVSGRGVGMDVVKNVVEGMGGIVNVFSKPGKGTKISLSLPRSIAIVNVLLIKVGDEIFGIPISKIDKAIEIYPHQIRESQGEKYYLERQHLIPLIPLHKFLDLKVSEDGHFPVYALLVEVHQRRIALQVDELVGQEEAFIRPLGKPLEQVSGLAGVTVLGNGRVVFILDIMNLL